MSYNNVSDQCNYSLSQNETLDGRGHLRHVQLRNSINKQSLLKLLIFLLVLINLLCIINNCLVIWCVKYYISVT